jgi:hypothetical protein
VGISYDQFSSWHELAAVPEEISSASCKTNSHADHARA